MNFNISTILLRDEDSPAAAPTLPDNFSFPNQIFRK